MNTYLIDLLNSNSRIIIPEFGAFIIKQKNPRIIVFNEFLRYNDGLLIDYIAVKENIEKDAAKEKVSVFVKELNEKMKVNEEVFIEGLGSIMKDNSDKIILKEKEDNKDLKEKKAEKDVGLKDDKVKNTEIKLTQTEAKTISKPVPAEKDILEIINNKEEEQTNKKIEKSEAMPKKNLKTETKNKPVEKIAEQKNEPETIKVEPVKKEDTVVLKRPEPVNSNVEKTAYQPVKSKTNSHVILWILLIIIVNGLILGWFIFNDKLAELFSKNKKETTELVSAKETNEGISSEEIKIESENIPEITDEVTQENTQIASEVVPQDEFKAATGEKKYYIIAGCFRDLKNANALVNELKAKGFKPEQFGKIGNLFAVSYSSYLDKSQANEDLKKIRLSEQAEAWIIYY